MKESSDVLKYQSKNPFKRFLIDRFLKKVAHEVNNIKPDTIIDLGCGEGYFEEYLFRKGFRGEILGVDVSESAVKEARRKNPKFRFQKGDIFTLSIDGKSDLVLLLEVVEHLSYPQKAVETAKKLSNKIIISVPWEPWFSWLSFFGGNYIRRLGRHPEHVWFFNERKLAKLLSKNFSNFKIVTSFPWLIAVCQNK